MHRTDHDTGRKEKGSALILVIFVLVALSGMGLALLFMSESEMKMGRADLSAKKAFYMAETAVEHGRLALFAANGGGSFDDELQTAAGGTSPWSIDFDPAALQPLFNAQGALTGFSAGVADDVPLVPVTLLADGGYAAYLTNDPLETTGSASDGNGRVMITGIGAGPDRSFEIVQAIVEYDPILKAKPPATITLLGPSPNFTPGNSNAKVYDGNDCSGSGNYYPTVGAVGASATQAVRNNQGKPTYNSGGLPPEQTIADLTDTSEPTVTTPIDGVWTNCIELRDMIEEIRGVADMVCTASPCVLPPATPDRVVFIDMDYNLNQGDGLMVVTGRLNFTGNVSWSGMLLVVGEGEVQRSGGGNGALMGSIVVADIAGPDNIYGTADDCTGPDAGFDQAEFTTNGGGNSTVGYCEATIEAATPQGLYRITEFLQR